MESRKLLASAEPRQRQGRRRQAKMSPQESMAVRRPRRQQPNSRSRISIGNQEGSSKESRCEEVGAHQGFGRLEGTSPEDDQDPGYPVHGRVDPGSTQADRSVLRSADRDRDDPDAQERRVHDSGAGQAGEGAACGPHGPEPGYGRDYQDPGQDDRKVPAVEISQGCRGATQTLAVVSDVNLSFQMAYVR